MFYTKGNLEVVFTTICIVTSSLLYVDVPARAEVIPDQSLGEQSTTVTTGANSNQLVVVGGARRGANLFHSFENLSVDLNDQVLFENSIAVERIFGRVTGGSISEIDGLIGTNGSADLFLINPAGISFGPNAIFRIGGSFIASSASYIGFTDGFEFNTTDNSDVLSTSVPVGLGFSGNSPVSVEGPGHTLSSGNLIFPYVESQPSPGLSIAPHNTVALIGADLSLDRGVIRASDGRIVLGAVKEGMVSLLPAPEGWRFSFDRDSDFGDIALDNFSILDVAGTNGGLIHIYGQDIRLLNSSVALSASLFQGNNLSETRVFGDSILIDGEISRVPEGVVIEARPSVPIPFVPSSLIMDGFAEGKPGRIEVQGQTVSVENGGAIYSRSFGQGVPGDVVVSGDRLLVNSANSISGNPSGIAVASIGNADSIALDRGEIMIDITLLELTNGGGITSSTFNGVSGGRILIDSARIRISSATETLGFPSQISALSLQAGLSPNVGDSGQILVRTEALDVSSGGLITTSSDNSGNAGDITINAEDYVRVGGGLSGAAGDSAIESAVVEFPAELSEVFEVSGVPTGNGGSVFINTPVLAIENGLVSARNDGAGAAGDINIVASRVDVLDGSQVAASTAEGAGGNIRIGADSILVGDGSINTAALSDGDGGNIIIDSGAIALLQDSSISANAELGSGGQVTITTDALLQSPDSSISATSEVGSAQDGVVEVQAPDEAPRAESDIEPPAIEVPQVTAACAQGSRQNGEFTVTGRGGLPTSPNDIQQTYNGWPSTPTPEDMVLPARSSQISEAQGWLSHGDGTIRFTDRTTNLISALSRPTACVNGSVS